MKRSNGEGSIYKRKDGRWCAAFYVDEETVHRYFVYGKTQAEVKKKMKDILSRGEYSQGSLHMGRSAYECYTEDSSV